MENKPLTERERIDALVFRLGISIRQLAKIVDMNENTFYHITDNSRFGISERHFEYCAAVQLLYTAFSPFLKPQFLIFSVFSICVLNYFRIFAPNYETKNKFFRL